MDIGKSKDAATGFLKSFKAFALKGNVVDLAVAVVIGGAFGKIVTSFVQDMIMPCVNPLLAQAGKDWRTWTLWDEGIKLGSFLGALVDFVIIAFVLFLVIRALLRLKTKDEPPAPPPDPAKEREERLVLALERLNQILEKNGAKAL